MAITPASQTRAAAVQATLSENYLDFSTGWAQQYLPDLIEKEAEVFGKRTVAGFLAQVGAEEAMAADQVVWSEQGRLHLSYTGTIGTHSANTINLTHDVDSQAVAAGELGIRVGDTILVASSALTEKCLVTMIDNNDAGVQQTTATQFITAVPYSSNATLQAVGFGTNDAVTVMVYGSEWGKGTAGTALANKPSFTRFTNKPVIIKDMYQVSGSDASQIGWVEVSGEEGQNGYLWYLKAEGDTRARFGDYCEMALIEAEKTGENSAVALPTDGGAGTAGTEGLFAAITNRGNLSSGITGVNAATDLAEFDAMLAEFDKNGAIEENMMFVNRSTALAMDDMLASMNSYGAGGTSYGVFDNSEDMALNLGFSGFRRGSYDFYKSDWKYLNDFATRGGINDRNKVGAVRGVVIPAGVSSVYDENLGKNLKRPFLHVRYRASQTESRKMKTWITGSVGAVTSDLDAMTVNFLSERCLVVQGANNFCMLN